MEVLYPGYGLLFIFDNTISPSINTKGILQVAHMNKRPGKQQLFLCAGWYIIQIREVVSQKMSTMTINHMTGQSTVVQKEIQTILVERKL